MGCAKPHRVAIFALIFGGTKMRTAIVAITLLVAACGQNSAPSATVAAPETAAGAESAPADSARYDELSPLVHNAGMWSVLSSYCAWPEATQYEGARERIYAAHGVAGDTSALDAMWAAGVDAGTRMAERARTGEGAVACGAAVKQSTLEELARLTTAPN